MTDPIVLLTIDSVGDLDFSYANRDAQKKYFDACGARYGVECVGCGPISTSYVATWRGQKSKVQKLLRDEYGIDEADYEDYDIEFEEA